MISEVRKCGRVDLPGGSGPSGGDGNVCEDGMEVDANQFGSQDSTRTTESEKVSLNKLSTRLKEGTSGSRPTKGDDSSDSDEDERGGKDSPSEQSGKQKSKKKGEENRKPQFLTTEHFRMHPYMQLFATGPPDLSVDPYRFSCRMCGSDKSVKTKGPVAVIRKHFNGKHLLGDQKWRHENGYPVYGEDGVPLSGEALRKAREVFNQPSVTATSPSGRRKLLFGQPKETLLDRFFCDDPKNELAAQIHFILKALKMCVRVENMKEFFNFFADYIGKTGTFRSFDWSEPTLFVSCPLHFP